MSEGGEEVRRQETIHRLVNNRNNLEALFLRRTLVSYEKELFLIIKRLDDEKLDWMDFTKRIRRCESDSMPEFDWVYKTLREHPPSPIELTTPACIRADVPFPLLSPATKHSLINQSGSESLRTGTRTATARESESRSRHEPREDLRGDHTVTRRDADLERLVLPAPSRDSAGFGGDVLTKLPSIHPRTSRGQRGAPGLGGRSETGDGRLRRDGAGPQPAASKACTDTELPRQLPRQLLGPSSSSSASRDKPHVLSTSDIPDSLLLLEGHDSGLTPRGLADRRPRNRQRVRSVRPLDERVGDFYRRFDTWLVQGTKPSSAAIGDDFGDGQRTGDPQPY